MSETPTVNNGKNVLVGELVGQSLIDIIANAPCWCCGGDNIAFNAIAKLTITSEMLSERDFEPEIGGNPLHWAVLRNFPKTTRLLLERGASVQAQSKLDNYQPMHVAAMSPDTDREIIEALKEFGASFCAITMTADGCYVSPIDVAIIQGNTNVLDIFEEISLQEILECLRHGFCYW